MVPYAYTHKETAMICVLSVWKMITANMKGDLIMDLNIFKDHNVDLIGLDEIDDQEELMVVAHFTGDYFGEGMPEPTRIDYYVCAGDVKKYRDFDDNEFTDMLLYGKVDIEILTSEWGYFTLLSDIRKFGCIWDEDFKPIPASQLMG